VKGVATQKSMKCPSQKNKNIKNLSSLDPQIKKAFVSICLYFFQGREDKLEELKNSIPNQTSNFLKGCIQKIYEYREIISNFKNSTYRGNKAIDPMKTNQERRENLKEIQDEITNFLSQMRKSGMKPRKNFQEIHLKR